MTHQEIMIRTARRNELDVVRSLLVEIVSDLTVYSMEARQSEIAKYSLRSLQVLHDEDADHITVAVGDQGICGFCVTKEDDGLLWLSWYGVAHSTRQRGVGAMLLRSLTERSAKAGYWKIWCDSRSDNKASIDCLLKAGFKIICAIDRHWYGQDFVLMERYLDDFQEKNSP